MEIIGRVFLLIIGRLFEEMIEI